MLSSGPTTATVRPPDEGDEPDVALRELLDHIAIELAHEYIRLMEAAAEAEPD